jgi:hypothetical protein
MNPVVSARGKNLELRSSVMVLTFQSETSARNTCRHVRDAYSEGLEEDKMAVPYNKILSDSEVHIGDRILKKGDAVFELLEAIEAPPPVASRPAVPLSEAELRQMITEAAERVARDLVPEIAEKIIREEIEKLKKT